jgi:GT2 family glycosyltransferase
MMPPWLTIVTAIRDDDAGLEATVRSIQSQDQTDVEVIVIDSSRNAASVATIIGSTATVQWTEPQGIYPAMNTGLAVASGTYTYFLNAGDTFYDSDVLSDVRAAISASQATWAFGPVQVVGENGKSVITPPWNYKAEQARCFARGHFPSHQGTFALTSALRDMGGFDTRYQISADYAAFLKLSQLGDPIEITRVIATFSEGGTSTLRWRESFREFHKARRRVLSLHGKASVVEQWDTWSHYARVEIYRSLIRRARR